MKKILFLCCFAYTAFTHCMEDKEPEKKLFYKEKRSFINKGTLYSCSYLATPVYVHNGQSLDGTKRSYEFTALPLPDIQKIRTEHWLAFQLCLKKCSEYNSFN